MRELTATSSIAASQRILAQMRVACYRPAINGRPIHRWNMCESQQRDKSGGVGRQPSKWILVRGSLAVQLASSRIMFTLWPSCIVYSPIMRFEVDRDIILCRWKKLLTSEERQRNTWLDMDKLICKFNMKWKLSKDLFRDTFY